jgi:hypothetical protein
VLRVAEALLRVGSEPLAGAERAGAAPAAPSL